MRERHIQARYREGSIGGKWRQVQQILSPKLATGGWLRMPDERLQDRLQRLKNEQLILRNLLDTVSATSRPDVNELLDIVDAEIEQEQRVMLHKQGAVD
jgi:hypothetical protein